MISFSDGILSAEVSPLGAELVSLKKDGRELLWQNENGSWTGHAPVLFPVCGMRSFSENGKVYRPARHGFARTSLFETETVFPNGASFVLRENDDMGLDFPYPFLFRVRYELQGRVLFIRYEAENPSETPLWFSCGGHESFSLSRDLSEYSVRLPDEEKLTRLYHDGNGRLTGEKETFAAREIPLSSEGLRGGGTIILAGPKARSAELVCRGETVARTEFKGFGNLLLWMPGKTAVCIEPWLSLPERADDAPLPLSRREGFVRLNAGEKAVFERSIAYFP